MQNFSNTTHDFSAWLRTCSIPADIYRFRSQIEKLFTWFSEQLSQPSVLWLITLKGVSGELTGNIAFSALRQFRVSSTDIFEKVTRIKNL